MRNIRKARVGGSDPFVGSQFGARRGSLGGDQQPLREDLNVLRREAGEVFTRYLDG
jgi:hypothetical protein